MHMLGYAYHSQGVSNDQDGDVRAIGKARTVRKHSD